MGVRGWLTSIADRALHVVELYFFDDEKPSVRQAVKRASSAAPRSSASSTS